jgi:flavodoxin
MNSLVIYASHFGNTKRIGEAIAMGLRTRGTVTSLSADEASSRLPPEIDLVLIGGPTEQHGMTQSLRRFLDELAPGALQDISVAAFDTRLRWPQWLSGSAALGITEKLREAGAHVIAPPESFFIKGILGTGGRNTAELDFGELDRATAWAKGIADTATRRSAVVPG